MIRKTSIVVAFLTIMLYMVILGAWGKDSSGIPDRDFTLWGVAYLDNAPLTRDDIEYTISLRVDGVEVASYAMGSRSANQDWYVLRVPMSIGEQSGYAQWGDDAQIYINSILIITAYLEPAHQSVAFPISVGNPGEAVRMDIYAQIPPQAIDDLSASTGANDGAVDLTWTAPGNNGDLGTVTGYVVKYSQNPITNQTEFDNAYTFPQNWTPKPPGGTEAHAVTNLDHGETYYFAVEAFDSVPIQAPMSNNPVNAIAKAGIPPVASALEIRPREPEAVDDLVGDYIYSDAGGRSESSLTEIRWYRDNALRSGYNDVLTIPSSATLKGQRWYFTVRPHNGSIFGDLQTSAFVTIDNTRPVVSNSFISPSSPTTGNNLAANYEYSDADGDPETGTTIRWYRNGSVRSAYNDQKILPSEATARGQQWRFTVRPGDGTELGPYQTSPTISIVNSPPEADAGGTYEGVVGEEIVFDGSGTSDPDDDSPLTYTWDFGDNTTGEGVNPTHAYDAAGRYTVKLIVADSSGDFDDSSTRAFINDAPKEAQQAVTELEIGWNMFSISLRPTDSGIQQVLSSIAGRYDAIWTYDAASEEWYRYNLNSPSFLNNLNELKAGVGYWISMTEPGILMTQGAQPGTTIVLEPGWNLVGYNSQTAKPLVEAMSSISGKYNSVWTYDAHAGQWLRYVLTGQSFLNDLEFMQSGRGYWIDVKERCLWDVGL